MIEFISATKETYYLLLKNMLYVSEIIFKNLAGAKKDKNLESRGQLYSLKLFKHPSAPSQNR